MVIVCDFTCCRIDVRFRQCMHVQALITGCGYCTCNIASKTQPLLSFSRSLLPRLPGTTQLPQPTTALVARLLSLMHMTLMIIQVNVTDIHSV